MSKLLNKPFKWFTIYAMLILVASIPVYYYAVESIWFEELDEKNWTVVQRIESGIKKVSPDQKELHKTLEIWNSLQPETKLIALKENDLVKTKVYTDNVYNPFEKENDRFRVLSTTIFIQGKPYLLTVSTNVEEADETLSAIAFVTVLFFVLLVLGFIILNRFISKNTWKPFYNTLNKLKYFDLNKDKKIKLESSKIQEFEELNHEITSLINNNISAFSQQKRFIENASHELQTPLAILRTKLDVLMQDEKLTEEQNAIIESITNNLSRISRINKNLLLLSKIENQQFEDVETIELRDPLVESISLLEDYSQNKGIQFELNTQSYSLKCNFTLLEVLLNNLLTNAIRHGKENDIVRVSLKENKLVFSNSGESALNEKQLFVRFAISSTETTNSGLGLAISKEICDRYNWKIAYLFSENKHVFSIEF